MGAISSQSLISYKNQSLLFSSMRSIIAFEGHDGSGKSSCIKSIFKPEIAYRFPGGSSDSESIRKILKKGNVIPKVQYLLNLACFSQTIDELVCISDMEKMYLIETPIVFDRYWPSLFVYQHFISGVPSERIFNDLRFYRIPFGNIFFFFYCDYDVARKRIGKRRSSNKGDEYWESYLNKTIQYYQNVRFLINNTCSNVYMLNTSNMGKNEVNDFVRNKILEHGYENILL